VKFDRKSVIELILKETNCHKKFGKISLTVTGKFKDATIFSGTTTIKIIKPPNRHTKNNERIPHPFQNSLHFSP